MGRALELKPLLVAAAIGAAAYYLLERLHGHPGRLHLALGAGVGVAVQLGVRIAGVS